MNKKYNLYSDINEWLKNHDGKFPRANIRKKGERINVSQLTPDEVKEVNLAEAWRKSEEYKIYKKYRECATDEIPEEYRQDIINIRTIAKKSTQEMVKRWIKAHNGKTPRRNIVKNGIRMKRSEMSEEEKEEVKLNQRWKDSKSYKIFKQYINEAEENIPKEYVRMIREYKELIQPEARMLKIMRKAVGKRVGDNEVTRNEIRKELEYQQER